MSLPSRVDKTILEDLGLELEEGSPAGPHTNRSSKESEPTTAVAVIAELMAVPETTPWHSW